MSSLPETLVQFRTDLEEAIGREHAARLRQGRRRRRIVVLGAAVLVVVVGTASAFGTVRELFLGSGGSALGSPTWSPDGRRIAFLHHRWDDTAFTTEVYVMNADGSRQRNLTHELGLVASAQGLVRAPPIRSPNWRKIAFESDPCAAVRGTCVGTTTIYVMNADGSGKRRLARGVRVRKHSGGVESAYYGHPAWSPDGRKIGFVSERDGNAEIYVMNADGGRQRNLTRNGAVDSNLVWSPDGRKIIFVSDRDGSSLRAPWSIPREIYVMNADGSGQRHLTQGPGGGGSPAWSPDGRKIAFRSDRDGNGEVYVMNADGSGERNLTPDDRPARRARDGSPALSPDGRRIAFVSARDGNGQIYVMNADGSGLRRLTRN